jgi:hypothetical protein
MRPPIPFLVLLAAGPLLAQAPIPAPQQDESPFRRLDLPTPTLIRTGAGTPGPAYWQQRVDYVIKATLDTAANAVIGDERITYTNNSPDTLRYLWLQLDQNLYGPGSRGAALNPGTPTDGGMRLVWVGEPAVAPAKGRAARAAAPLTYSVNNTVMRIDLAQPLPPKGRQLLSISWTFPFGPKRNRMGIETIDGSTIFEVAQWYPRLAVYDDVRGWNTEQYLGYAEFYLEYGSFDVSLTVPANMLVAATGTLRNPEQVLTAAQRSRLAEARRSARTVIVRGKTEIDDPASRPAAPGGALVWRFTADSVRDFAWAAARQFIWDAVGANNGKVLVMSFYPPSADSIWNRASEYGKLAIERYSKQWWPFPYAFASNVNGIEGGMEYPMIVFCHNRTVPEGLYGVTDHEFGHTWFPMLVGSNERLYGWQDEGFNTFMNHYNWEQQYPGKPNRRGSSEAYLQYVQSGRPQETIMTPPDRLHDVSQLAYNKPGLGLRLLRDVVLGADRFDPAFREYIRRWAYKHPTPADFFRTIEDGAGEDLSWFWRGWFYTNGTIDQAADSVTVSDTAGVVSRIYLRSVGSVPMPVELALTLGGGGSSRLKLPVDIWFRGDTFVATVAGDVTGVRLDPDQVLPDVDRSNNQWPRVMP